MTNVRNYDDETPIYYIIGFKMYELAKDIINAANDIDLNASDLDGMTPLILAVSQFINRDQDLMKLMISRGADPKFKPGNYSAIEMVQNKPIKSELIPLFTTN